MKRVITLIVVALIVVACGSDGPKEVKLKEGEKVVTSYANGTPMVVRKTKTVDGKVESTYEKEYYEDGNMSKEGPVKNSQRNGVWKSYYRDGELMSIGKFKNGVRQDTIKGYYNDGTLKYVGLYQDGQKTGTWLIYDESGNLKENQVYIAPDEVRETDLYIQDSLKN